VNLIDHLLLRRVRNIVDGQTGRPLYHAPVVQIAEYRRHPSDDDHGDLRDGTQGVKAERSGDASSHQFDAKNEPATSTLPTSLRARYHKYVVTGNGCIIRPVPVNSVFQGGSTHHQVRIRN
jgi:hypothetical protein